jgi:hypothetical protein
LHGLQQVMFGRAIARTTIDTPPLFIVGHWRTGTTLLHELLVLDERYAYPTTYECFAANHYLVSRRLTPWVLGFLLPARRPTDDMVVSLRHPQEDEFGLLAMGAPSPICRLAFPNERPFHQEFLDMQDVAETDLKRWKRTMVQFVRVQTYRKNKPLVLKSPPHTGRLEVLNELFPGAKFIHIVRDPVAVFSSTRRLWIALEEAQGLQVPRYEHLDEIVFDGLERMYRGFERQRGALEPAQICDVRYEDLVQDPVGQMRQVYEQLQLGDFSAVQSKIQAYLAQRTDYQANRHELEPAIRNEVARRWAPLFEKYGYVVQPAACS